MQQKTSTFFALSLSYPGCSHVGSLFTSGDPKGLARDVTDTSATQAQFKTSHAQNDTHKTAVLMVLFPCLKKKKTLFCFTSLSLAGNSDHLNRHCSCKNSITPTYQCVQHFCVSKQWYGCQCLGFLMSTHVTAHRGCMDTVRESALEVRSGRQQGVEPVLSTAPGFSVRHSTN